MKNYTNFNKINENNKVNSDLYTKNFPKLYNVITDIINETVDYLEKIVANYVVNYNSKPDIVRPLSEIDIDDIRYSLIFKLVKSLSAYIKEDDKLVSVDTRISQGSLEINSIIERDKTKYNLITESILAGGYNIQKLHVRYIINSDLPKVDTKLMAEVKKVKQSTDNKIKTQKEIERIERTIKRHEKEIDADFEPSVYPWSKNNISYTEEEWNKYMEEQNKEKEKSFKNSKKMNATFLKKAKKDIIKLQDKLEDLNSGVVKVTKLRVIDGNISTADRKKIIKMINDNETFLIAVKGTKARTEKTITLEPNGSQYKVIINGEYGAQKSVIEPIFL